MRAIKLFAAACALPLCLATAAAAEDVYPARTVKLVVPATPGGPIDAIARILADAFKTKWPEPVVVENRPGAGTTTGIAYVAAAPADGYTLLISPDSIAVNPSLYPHVGYDPLKSFEPISLVATATQVLVVRPGIGVGDFKQFMDYAKRNGTGVNLATAGTGTISHLTEVLLEQKSGVTTTHIPFKGAAPALTALLGAHVDAMWVMLAPAVPYLKSGTLVPVAVTSAAREPNLPGVPTVAESGLADFLVENWQGLFAPAGTPRPIVDKVAAAVADLVTEPEVRARMTAIGFDVRGEGPAILAARVRADIPKWADVVKRAGIKLGD